MVDHVDRLKMDVDDVGVHFEFEMGEHRDALEMRTQGERDPTTFTSASASISKLVKAPSVPPHPSTKNLSITLISVTQ